jgi:hypothetical protein
MSARPRDIVKSRAQRLSEVCASVWLKSGMADGEAVLFGGNLTTTTTTVALSDTCAVIGGAFVDKAAQTAIAVPGGAATGASQECIVLYEMDASGTVTATAGAVASTGSAVRPAENAARVTLGQLKVGASFVPGTTNTSTGVLTKEPYFT